MNRDNLQGVKWAKYIRKSTEDNYHQVQSLDDQEKILDELAKRENLNVVATFKESKSAKMPDVRTGFMELLDLIEKGKVDGLLVWKLDRLSRNALDSGRLQHYLHTGKIKCIKTPEKNHLPGDNSIIFAVESGMSAEFSRGLSTVVKRGMVSKAEKGWLPGSATIGYLNSKTKEKGSETILVDELNFPIIRKGWDLMLTGNYTVPKVHKILTEEYGLRTVKRRTLGGKEFSLSFMYKVFTNMFYAGYFTFGGKLYEGKHKAMITMEEYDKVQMLLGRKGNPRPKTLEFPYTGIMKCDECGAQITATEKRKFVKKVNKVNTYVYYHCTGKKKIVKCTAKTYVKSEVVDEQVMKILSDNSIGQKFYELGLSVLKDVHANEVNDKEVVYKQQIEIREDMQKKLNNSLQFLLSGTISEVDYKKNKSALEVELQKQDIKIRELENHTKQFNELTEKAFHFMRHSMEAFTNGDLQTKKDIMSALGLNQRLNRKNFFIDLHSWMKIIKTGENLLLPQLLKSEKNINLIPQGEKVYNNELFISGCPQ